jgi:hypothetical protein
MNLIISLKNSYLIFYRQRRFMKNFLFLILFTTATTVFATDSGAAAASVPSQPAAATAPATAPQKIHSKIEAGKIVTTPVQANEKSKDFTKKK